MNTPICDFVEKYNQLMAEIETKDTEEEIPEESVEEVTETVVEEPVEDVVEEVVEEIVPEVENEELSGEDLEAAIKDTTILITIMYANNEIGTIQPIKEIGEIAKKHNIIFHTDAVQAAGNIDIDVKKYNIGLVVISHEKALIDRICDRVVDLMKNKNV